MLSLAEIWTHLQIRDLMVHAMNMRLAEFSSSTAQFLWGIRLDWTFLRTAHSIPFFLFIVQCPCSWNCSREGCASREAQQEHVNSTKQSITVRGPYIVPDYAVSEFYFRLSLDWLCGDSAISDWRARTPLRRVPCRTTLICSLWPLQNQGKWGWWGEHSQQHAPELI